MHILQRTKLGDAVQATQLEMLEFGTLLLNGTSAEKFEVFRDHMSFTLRGTLTMIKKQTGNMPVDASEVTHLSMSRGANKTWIQANQKIERHADERLFRGPITSKMLLEAAHTIQTYGTISLGTLLGRVVGRGCGDHTRRTMLSLILLFLPVGALGSIHIDGNCVLVDLRSEAGAQTIEQRLVSINPKKPKKPSTNRTQKKRGRDPIEMKVNTLVEAVIKHVNAHAPEASHKRRHQIIKTGISLGQLLEALKKDLPGLEMDKRTLARLMCPPNKGNKAASAYKQLVSARITAMQNDLKIEKNDGHYSCAQVSLLKEMIAWIGEEATLVSCDEKAQLVVGEAGLVGRLVCTRVLSFVN